MTSIDHAAHEWLAFAREDAQAAKILAENGVFRASLYHCQQSVEKYFKAYLVSKSVTPPKTHDLVLLVGVCFEWEKEFAHLVEAASFLTAYATKTRYPDSGFIPTEEDVARALRILDKVETFFLKLF